LNSEAVCGCPLMKNVTDAACSSSRRPGKMIFLIMSGTVSCTSLGRSLINSHKLRKDFGCVEEDSRVDYASLATIKSKIKRSKCCVPQRGVINV
jgi:hypothetical protein